MRKAMVVMSGIVMVLGSVVGPPHGEAIDSCTLRGDYSLSALGEAAGFLELMGLVNFNPFGGCNDGVFTANLTLKRQGGAGVPIVVTGTYDVDADGRFIVAVPGVIGLTGLLSQVAGDIANAFNFVARFEQGEPIVLAGSAFRQILVLGVQIVSSETAINVANPKFASVACPQGSEPRPGIKVLSGGAQVIGFPADVNLNQSSPTLPGGTGWSAQAEKATVSNTAPGAAWGLRVFAICADAASIDR